ncbi:hypothetical protein P692DRAFT_201809935 [Suillus brevipes Sb2]|nr:hypothetical protein P692DRAFT_201809935 [Suillus brevipes Sb2]
MQLMHLSMTARLKANWQTIPIFMHTDFFKFIGPGRQGQQTISNCSGPVTEQNLVRNLPSARNTDFWPVVLSASLQAFYTLYKAILVFLSQQLAMSSALIRRLKLTTIHDISSAWAGLGSALSSIWIQTGISASLWATTAVTTYLVCISVLHVTSSTLLQFQTFNSSMSINVSTTLGWVDVTTAFNPVPITASLPAISQFPGLISAGPSY